MVIVMVKIGDLNGDFVGFNGTFMGNPWEIAVNANGELVDSDD